MAGNVTDIRSKATDSEKITINLGYVDLGHVDLLVQEGFYSNRTDFIRTAIRNQIERHADVVRQAVTRKSVDLGLRHFTREDLEAAKEAGQVLDIRVLGLATIGPGRNTRTRPRHHRLADRAGGAARQRRRQGSPRGPHQVTAPGVSPLAPPYRLNPETGDGPRASS